MESMHVENSVEIFMIENVIALEEKIEKEGLTNLIQHD
jgi:hypothetical protein